VGGAVVLSGWAAVYGRRRGWWADAGRLVAEKMKKASVLLGTGSTRGGDLGYGMPFVNGFGVGHLGR